MIYLTCLVWVITVIVAYKLGHSDGYIKRMEDQLYLDINELIGKAEKPKGGDDESP